MPSDNFLSVILPVYNGERFVAEALSNIYAQNYAPLEIIVVDDGSTDGTAERVRAFQDRVRCIRQENRGPAAARNRGLELARGTYITFKDVDDLWTPGALLKLGAVLDAAPSVEIAQGLTRRLTAVPSATGTLVFNPSSVPYQFIHLGSAVYRRAVFDKVGWFDETLWENEDTDWFLRAWENGIVKQTLDEVVLLYRLHDKNMVYSRNLIAGGLPRLFKLHLDRRRRNKLPIGTAAASLPEIGRYIGSVPNNQNK